MFIFDITIKFISSSQNTVNLLKDNTRYQIKYQSETYFNEFNIANIKIKFYDKMRFVTKLLLTPPLAAASFTAFKLVFLKYR